MYSDSFSVATFWKRTLKATEQDKYENIAGSVWLSLFMSSNGNAYYFPRRPAPGGAQLNIYTNKQYNLDPSQTIECPKRENNGRN
jgi:hypothetical protein